MFLPTFQNAAKQSHQDLSFEREKKKEFWLVLVNTAGLPCSMDTYVCHQKLQARLTTA